jgi:hypothetical protein
MYNVITKLAKENGYKPPEQIETETDNYVDQRTTKMVKDGKPDDVPGLSSGQSIMIGTTVFQKGVGYLGKGNTYDRYVPFKLYPDCDYLVTQWPMAMIQVSANPFSPKKNHYDLGKLILGKVMGQFKSELSNVQIPLDYIKYTFERDISKLQIKDAVGFKWADFFNLFSDKIKGIDKNDSSWNNLIKDITDKQYSFLSKKQKELIKKITVSEWDVVMASSGGHYNITNISGLGFGKNTKELLNRISMAIMKEMKDKHLS